MNIFYLDKEPRTAASYLVDVHVRKMLVETCQILSTVQRSLLGYRETLVLSGQLKYRQTLRNPKLDRLIMESTHENHPCVKWVMEAAENHNWLTNYVYCLDQEYLMRFGRQSIDKKTYDKLILRLCVTIPTACFPSTEFTEPPCAMPKAFSSRSHLSTVSRYRLYYKHKLTNNPNTIPSVWTGHTNKPEWI